jgi:Delta7-sterol 5-desaturase
MESSFPIYIPIVVQPLRYFIFAGIPFAIFYLLHAQAFANSKIQEKKARQKDFWREIRHSMQSIIVFIAVAVLIKLTPLKVQIYTDISSYPIWWLFASIFIALAIHDTYFYWMHRAIHHRRLFKTCHLVHHQSVNPSPWAAYSFNLIEAVLEALIAPILLCMLPLHPLALLAFTSISFSFNVYGHLGYEIAPKWFRNSWLFEVMNTSVYHNMHHAKFKGNYGLYFRFWDRIMHTEHPDYVADYDALQAQRFPISKSIVLCTEK